MLFVFELKFDISKSAVIVDSVTENKVPKIGYIIKS